MPLRLFSPTVAHLKRGRHGIHHPGSSGRRPRDLAYPAGGRPDAGGDPALGRARLRHAVGDLPALRGQDGRLRRRCRRGHLADPGPGRAGRHRGVVDAADRLPEARSSSRCCSRCWAWAAGRARSPRGSGRRSADSCTGCGPRQFGCRRGRTKFRSPAATPARCSTSPCMRSCWPPACWALLAPGHGGSVTGSGDVGLIDPLVAAADDRRAGAAGPARQDDLPGRPR